MTATLISTTEAPTGESVELYRMDWVPSSGTAAFVTVPAGWEVKSASAFPVGGAPAAHSFAQLQRASDSSVVCSAELVPGRPGPCEVSGAPSGVLNGGGTTDLQLATEVGYAALSSSVRFVVGVGPMAPGGGGGGGGGFGSTVTNTYTSSGAIDPTDSLSLVDSSGAAAMTLASGAVDGHGIVIKRIGAGSVTVTASIDGTGGASVVADSPSIKEAFSLVWDAGRSTWLTV